MGTMSTRLMAQTGARHEEFFPNHLDALVRKVAEKADGPFVVPERPTPPDERQKFFRFLEDELRENRISLVVPEAARAEMIYTMAVEEPAPELRRSVLFALTDVRRSREPASWATFCADLASGLSLVNERATPLERASAIDDETRALLPSFFQRLGVTPGGMIPDTLRAAIAGALGLSEPPLPAWVKPGAYAFNPRQGVRGYNLKILSVSSSHVLLEGVVEQKPLPIGWFVASYKPSDPRINIAGFPCGECRRPLDDWGECGMCADRLWGVVVEGGISTTHLWWCRKTWRAMGASGACTCDAHRNKVEFWDPSRSDRLARAWYEIKGRASSAPMAPDLEKNLRTLARAMGDSFEDVVEAARQIGAKLGAKGDYLQSLPRCGQPSEDHATIGCGRYVGHTGRCDQALDLTAPCAFLPVEQGQIYSTSSGGRGVVDKRTGGDRWRMLWDKDDGSGTFAGLPTNVEEGARSGDWRLIGIQTPSGARVMVGEQRMDPGRTDDMQRGRVEVLAVLPRSKVRLRWPSGAWGTFEASTVAGWPIVDEAAEERPSELHLLMPLAEAFAFILDDSRVATRARIDIAIQLAALLKQPLHQVAFGAALRSLSEGICGARWPSAWEVRYTARALCIFERELAGLRAPAAWQVKRARWIAIDAYSAAFHEDLPGEDVNDSACCSAIARYLEARGQRDSA